MKLDKINDIIEVPSMAYALEPKRTMRINESEKNRKCQTDKILYQQLPMKRQNQKGQPEKRGMREQSESTKRFFVVVMNRNNNTETEWNKKYWKYFINLLLRCDMKSVSSLERFAYNQKQQNCYSLFST